jgi:hypothetical protein
MITTPDGSDSVAVCPAFSPVGPHPSGFFADCNPAQNFDGTRPLAEHFNELIVNLHALLKEGRVTAVKGDATMLWRAILQLQLIETSVTFNVTATGVAAPVNPFAGDPFDSLEHAVAFLARYRIAPGAMVTISIAAGTFTSASLVLGHPDGDKLRIQGMGPTLTTLRFPMGQMGLQVSGDLSELTELALEGQSTAASATPWLTSGLAITGGGCAIRNLTVRGFAGNGVLISGGTLGFNETTLTIQNNRADGLVAQSGSAVNASTIGTILTCSNNAGANITVQNSVLGVDDIRTTGGQIGIVARGSSTEVSARKIGVDVATNPAAVYATNGAMFIAPGNSVAGDWWTWDTAGSIPQNFLAEAYSFMRTGPALAANNRTNCSPALNVVGNIQAMINGI